MTLGAAAIALYALWLAAEMSFLRPARDRSGLDADRHSLWILASSNLAAPAVAITLYLTAAASDFSAGLRVSGLLLMLAGYAVRASGMWTLRSFFSANVAIQRGHRLMIDGPYRWVRHPGYFGGWLSFLGFGLALGGIAGTLVLALGTLPAFLYRIAVEEKVLSAAFPEHAGYRQRVRMFIPFIW